ncbi:ankyrin repeat protein [Biscogniauxia sp. FL1348]|nr:ankyrin repeat protein [Biscogniauxia sp. FL1348]
MAFWLDAQTGDLTKDKLEAYLKADPNITIDSEDRSGLTPLAYAILSGHSKVVKLLLDNGASPDKKIGDKNKPKDGRTPIYLAATANSQRARNVQLLLEKNPASFDEAISTRGGRTPLMAAVSQTKDPQVVKLLVQSGASLEKKDSKGQTAVDLADQLQPARPDIKDALQITPTRGRGGLDTFIQWVLAVLSFFNIWGPLSVIFDAAIRLFYKVASPVGVPPGEDVEEPRTVAEFKNNLDNAVRDGGLERFFPPGDPYIQQVAEKAAGLKDDPGNLLNTPRQINFLATLALYQPVLYCDDSQSMNNEGRWEKQKQLVERITNITNRAVPNRTGVHLRTINHDLPSADNLDGAAVAQKLSAFVPDGGTPIGTQLRGRVLEPLVYAALGDGDDTVLERPYLVLVTTDGCPWLEAEDMLRTVVLECARRLAGRGYRRDAVRFCLSQIGTDPEAKEFMDSLDMDSEVLEVLHRTSELLDARFDELVDNEKNLETWLLTMLLSPLQSLKAS